MSDHDQTYYLDDLLATGKSQIERLYKRFSLVLYSVGILNLLSYFWVLMGALCVDNAIPMPKDCSIYTAEFISSECALMEITDFSFLFLMIFIYFCHIMSLCWNWNSNTSSIVLDQTTETSYRTTLYAPHSNPWKLRLIRLLIDLLLTCGLGFLGIYYGTYSNFKATPYLCPFTDTTGYSCPYMCTLPGMNIVQFLYYTTLCVFAILSFLSTIRFLSSWIDVLKR